MTHQKTLNYSNCTIITIKNKPKLATDTIHTLKSAKLQNEKHAYTDF